MDTNSLMIANELGKSFPKVRDSAEPAWLAPWPATPLPTPSPAKE
jgi:hypothetical protein